MSGISVGKVRILLLEDGNGQAERLRDLLRDENMDLSVASRDIDQALQQVRTLSPDVILAAMSDASLQDVIERIDSASGGNPIVALLTPEQTANSREVLLAGARAFLPVATDRDELIDTIFSVLERERRRRAALAKQFGVEVDLGKIIAVHGSKGGVGATAIAVNLAIATRQATRQRVALVDANLYSGDVAACLNLMSRSSLADLTPHLKDLDQEFLERASVRHPSGIRAFLAPDDFVRAQAINGEQIGRILKVMRQHFDYIIVDTCSLPDQVTSAALEEANGILLVITPEVPALKNAARFLRLAGEFGYQEKIDLVLNRAKSRGAIGVGDIETHLHASIAVTIGSDGRTVPAAMNAGEPVIGQRRSRFSSGIWSLTTVVTGMPAHQVQHKFDQSDSTGPNGTSKTIVHVPIRQLTPAREQATLVGSNGEAKISTEPIKRLWSRVRSGE